MTEQVLACIDGSGHAAAVCDWAGWASQRLNAPLTFVHVLDREAPPVQGNLSGSIGLGSQEQLLAELAELDEQRGKLAREQGRLMLEAARARAQESGVTRPDTLQRHGALVDTLMELEPSTRLLVLGRHGEASGSAHAHLGSHVEQVIRALHRPILVTLEEFRSPEKVMLAFDGSATTRKGVEMLAASPLFKGLELHLVLAGADTDDNRAQLEWARQWLAQAGITAVTAIVPGEADKALTGYQQQHGMELMIMGAYGHSRIRQWLVGSTTTAMIRDAQAPLLVLR
ncbi:UspA-related nucleotide-binding protein [Oceanimonas sp. GK1]|uniref:universal stress protein n=1 Tax=Oceanimonas sp. (strain GK1 / IBRC-M 10197) TaxID=511062 RepID=UPI0002494E3B|nr:universal stress protein [Oceanimonas sp. GK1]AEY01660.1 UspA-related nucleotide-binding protein [Oceanimonas sp. GK1]